MPLVPTALRRGFEAVLEPIARGLIAARIHPNTITTVATLVLVGSGFAFGVGQVRGGGALLLLSGGLDMLDGKVARGGGKPTRFGAFYDSTLDRIGEAALFSGIAFYFLTAGGLVGAPWAIGITLVALSAGMTVSYARARAERILGLGAPTLFFGAGPEGLLLLTIVCLLAVTSVITVAQRIVHVYRTTRDVEGAPRARNTPAMVDVLEKGSQSG